MPERDPETKATAAEVAETLFEIMVVETANSARPENFGLPAVIWPQMLPKVRLYHEALVLMLLLWKAKDDPNCEELLKSYERMILPNAPTPGGVLKLEALKVAMRELGALVDPENARRELSWARAWLSDLGHEEYNPVKLTLIASYWMQAYAIVGETIKQLRPA